MTVNQMDILAAAMTSHYFEESQNSSTERWREVYLKFREELSEANYDHEVHEAIERLMNDTE